MTHTFLTLFLLFFYTLSFAQNSTLSIKQIMKGDDFVGHLPEDHFWSDDGSKIYFDWNPNNSDMDSLYYFSLENKKIEKVGDEELKLTLRPLGKSNYNQDRSKKIYNKDGDIFIQDLSDNSTFQLTTTNEGESNPKFINQAIQVVFTQKDNLFVMDLEIAAIKQITNFKKGYKKSDVHIKNDLQQFLADEELELMDFLKRKKEKSDKYKKLNELKKEDKKPKLYYYEDNKISAIELNPNQKFVTFQLEDKNENAKETHVPKYVNETGYTKDLPARSNVGRESSKFELGIYDIEKDTTFLFSTEDLPGIYDHPEFAKSEYDEDDAKETYISKPKWSANGKHAITIVHSEDNKDRWIVLLDCESGKLKSLDHQHNEAWIGGPGISQWYGYVSSKNWGWLPDNKTIWFQSQESGWSHLYSLNVETGKKKQLTKGKYEVFKPQISKDGQHWYFTASIENTSERHFYKMPIKGGKTIKITTLEGNNDVQLSPDEKYLAIRHSYSSKPWELYFQKNEPDANAEQITFSLTEDFKKYQWRIPELVDIKTSDGKSVKARLYQPEKKEQNGPAVVFVHGAGYLQNAHKWWSSYYREYMFHNFLVDNGYTVLDIDYRGSAGYGSEWRTDVYRHLGGKDLDDHVDAAKYLVDELNIDPDKIGIYGGSYGGFMVLMALFNSPETFACGAALRTVTDWAHYNHLYTSNRLNIPHLDSTAYRQSSPIYFAEGLEKPLLICHGMIDMNVHYQDVVRLSQRLIELGKEDWELAVYPLEGHSFTEPESWTDEYTRIFKLFQRHLK